MRVAFIGSDDFGAIGLESLASSRHEIGLVVTVPDRPKGRGRSCEPGPVPVVAEEYALPLIQPQTVRDPLVIETILDTLPDVISVVCYGEYIPAALFDTPEKKSINVHPSLLPRWRGASPVHCTLLAGDKITGVTVQYLSKRMDAGEILLQRETEIGIDENHGDLSYRLYCVGAEMLVEALDRLEKGDLIARRLTINILSLNGT